MTENEWLAETDIEYLLAHFEEKASRRKLRLFAIGCVRRILRLLPDESCRTAVDVAENYADGRTTLEMLRKTHTDSEIAINAAWRDARRFERDGMMYLATKQDALASDLPSVAQVITNEKLSEVDARDIIDSIACVQAHSAITPEQWGTSAGDDVAMRAVESERPNQLHLFRDVFGDPFRPITIDQEWLTPKVLALAQASYDDRAFDRLPILADALEETGCTNSDILAHCRGPGPHVRGCWVVDLLLRKE